MIKTDILIIGSGAAGMTAAIELSNRFKITLITKNSLIDSSTWYAQGGIAAVIDSNDTIEEHLRDTLIAGDGLCNEEAVLACVSHGKEAIKWLSALGANFTTDKSNGLHLTQEGGHSKRRVVHAEDATGKEVSSSLAEIVKNNKNIKVLENHICVDLITNKNRCIGAYVLDIETNKVEAFSAGASILATGGASKVYLYTSNPDGSSGDGIGLAWRAGCVVENLEFNQFHPTCLYHPEAKSFLISEALRGEGAILINDKKERFMEKYDSRLELAPRDVVARSIDKEMKISGAENVFLDISHRDAKEIKNEFPNIYEQCKKFGFDLTQEPIPVVPTCHYMMGGIPTNINGQVISVDNGEDKIIDGLYAAGEVACVSVHGGNRLGGNSLLDLVVFGRAAGLYIEETMKQGVELKDASNDDIDKALERLNKLNASTEGDQVAVLKEKMQQNMQNNFGVFRRGDLMEKGIDELAKTREEVDSIFLKDKSATFNTARIEALEMQNLFEVAEATAITANARKESRGAHARDDFTERDDENWLKHSIYYANTKEVSKRDVNYRPKTVQAFQPMVRSY